MLGSLEGLLMKSCQGDGIENQESTVFRKPREDGVVGRKGVGYVECGAIEYHED